MPQDTKVSALNPRTNLSSSIRGDLEPLLSSCLSYWAATLNLLLLVLCTPHSALLGGGMHHMPVRRLLFIAVLQLVPPNGKYSDAGQRTGSGVPMLQFQ